MKICKYCGAEVPDDAINCPSCGSNQFIHRESPKTEAPVSAAYPSSAVPGSAAAAGASAHSGSTAHAGAAGLPSGQAHASLSEAADGGFTFSEEFESAKPATVAAAGGAQSTGTQAAGTQAKSKKKHGFLKFLFCVVLFVAAVWAIFRSMAALL